LKGFRVNPEQQKQTNGRERRTVFQTDRMSTSSLLFPTAILNYLESPNASAPNKWLGITSSSTKMYGAPFSSDSVFVFDPSTWATGTIPLPIALQGTYQWSGIANANDTLYTSPYNANSILVINTATNQTSGISFPHSAVPDQRWGGIALSSVVKKFFLAPANETVILMIDPRTNATATLSFLQNDTIEKYYGLAESSVTKKLYFAPQQATRVLVVEPTNNSTALLSDLGDDVGWHGLAEQNGNLYCAPRGSGSVLVIVPQTNETYLILGPENCNTYDDVALGPDGLIYSSNWIGGPLLVIDPSQNSSATLGSTQDSANSALWGGIASFQNQILVCVPRNVTKVLVLSFQSALLPCLFNLDLYENGFRMIGTN